MKRSLIYLLCCTPLLLSPITVQSIELVAPKAQSILSLELYGPVNGNETLWGISEKLKPNNSVSIYQTLIAIYKLNPDAFEEGNVNKIIEYHMLKVPKLDFIKQQSAEEAVDLIKNKRTLAPTQRTVKSTIDEADLKLAAHIQSLKKELTNVNEKLIGTKDKNQILKIKLQGLTDQIESLNEQLSLKVALQKNTHALNKEYQEKLTNIKSNPFSGQGLINKASRFITSSIEHLFAFLFLPILLLSIVFIFILRRKDGHQLEAQQQKCLEQNSSNQEERFDLLSLADSSLDSIALAEANEINKVKSRSENFEAESIIENQNDLHDLTVDEEKVTDEELDSSDRGEVEIPIHEPIPADIKNAEEGFIDIETLLENSGTDFTEDTEFDLSFDLDEVAGEVHSEDLNESKNKISMKLDLARGYLEIDDKLRAKKILDSLLGRSEGKQKDEIEKLLSKLK